MSGSVRFLRERTPPACTIPASQAKPVLWEEEGAASGSAFARNPSWLRYSTCIPVCSSTAELTRIPRLLRSACKNNSLILKHVQFQLNKAHNTLVRCIPQKNFKVHVQLIGIQCGIFRGSGTHTKCIFRSSINLHTSQDIATSETSGQQESKAEFK